MSSPEVEPLTNAVGAEVTGVRLAELDFARAREIHALLMTYGVLFFREQHLTPEQQLAFAGYFGSPGVHPVSALFGGGDPLQTIEDQEGQRPMNEGWHTDVTYLPEPPRFAVLQSLELPPMGGDTLWASMPLAYEALPESLKDRLEGLSAIHDARFEENLVKRGLGTNTELVDRITAAFPPTEHPVVRTHPVTQKKLLYVNSAFTTHITQVAESEDQDLLRDLLEHVATPTFHCRYRWTEGDVAIWDELATQHFASADHYPAARRMRRCTVDGDRVAEGAIDG